MGVIQITKPKMEQKNSCDSNSGRGPTGGDQYQCKEKETKENHRNISFSMLRCSQFPGGCFVAVSNTLATAMFTN